MTIDPKMIEEWTRLAGDLPPSDLEPWRLSDALRYAVRSLLAERDGLLARIDTLLHGTPERRWNVTPVEGDRLLVCRGEHERAQDCEREAFVPAARLDEALAVMREVEWMPGDRSIYDTCPLCGGEEPCGRVPCEPHRDPDANPQQRPRIGHAPDCRLAALLR